jgi:hypothetical protein
VLCGALFLDALDVSMVGVALPSIRADLGLVLSGLLTEVSWRWTLLLPAPVAAVILVAGLRLIPRPGAAAAAGARDHARPGVHGPARRGFDLLGAATVTGGMLLLLVFAVVSALAVATAVIDARGADHAISAGTLAAYRPALAVITGVALFGLAVTLSGLRPSRARPAPVPGERAEAGLEVAGR